MGTNESRFTVVPLEAFLTGLYPTPKNRKADPIATDFEPGDLVHINIGPAIGRVGLVLVERNHNYHDYEPYTAPNSVGVQVVRQVEPGEDTDDPITKVFREGEEAGAVAICREWPELRWFDSPVDFPGEPQPQLTLLARTNI